MRTYARLCQQCSAGLLNIFVGSSIGIRPVLPRQRVSHLSTTRAVRNNDAAHLEGVVRQARVIFGDSLPSGLLSHDEYAIYERLYGPPSSHTSSQDLKAVKPPEIETFSRDDVPEHIEVDGAFVDPEDSNFENEEEGNEIVYPEEEPHQEIEPREHLSQTQEELYARVCELQAVAASETPPLVELVEGIEDVEEVEEIMEDEPQFHEPQLPPEPRTHPATLAGRFAGSPATIHLPKDTMVDPITNLLASASNKHVLEAAQKAFGGPGLPYSTSVAKGPNLRQQPIGLSASQFSMGEMEANAYMAAVMPGAYAATMSALVEVSRRLGPQWLEGLKERGPRVLDAGAGGAAILAWQQILSPTPRNRSTVVVGSAALRQRVSQILDDTTFIPRLPDYDASRDHPSLHSQNPQPRKQYDIIVAPHTLWPIHEEYKRKFQVQNLWSLLEPQGGVLILLEKGVPRGFELVAEAREMLLRHHIESDLGSSAENQFGGKEKGMILAPCTSHGKCPLYRDHGESRGRRDYCFFSHRYIRPPFQQLLTQAQGRNHEDVKFSFIAVQRGVDQRQEHNLAQSQTASDRAFMGVHENDHENPQSLILPRIILPPIKPQGHVILDVCTPAGKLERWTVPRSFSRQAYRDARKAQWGDLWALGAKTRVPRNVRLGKIVATAQVVKDKKHKRSASIQR